MRAPGGKSAVFAIALGLAWLLSGCILMVWPADGEDPPPNAIADAGEGREAAVECPEQAPLCCVGSCGNDVTTLPLCTQAGWICRQGSLSCPADQCRLPPLDPNAQLSYEYPACAKATYGCPNDLTYGCAITAIRSNHSTCSEDSDCVATSLEGECVSSNVPYAVASASLADFLAEAQLETRRYCDGATCRSMGDSFVHWRPICSGGQCEMVPASQP